MRRIAVAATLLSLALVGSASAQGIATGPVSGAAAGAAAGAARGAAAAGPVGGLVGAPYALAGGGYNYCPAGSTPVTPPNTLPPNITGVGYCQPLGGYAYPRRTLARRVTARRVTK